MAPVHWCEFPHRVWNAMMIQIVSAQRGCPRAFSSIWIVLLNVSLAWKSLLWCFYSVTNELIDR
jgi:hypothetical protein